MNTMIVNGFVNSLRFGIGGVATIGAAMYSAKGLLFAGNLAGRSLEWGANLNEKTQKTCKFLREHPLNYFRDLGDAKTLTILTFKCIAIAAVFGAVALLAFGKFDVINRISQLGTLIWNRPLQSA